MRLTRCQEEIDGTAQSVDDSMNFRRQPAFRASEGLLGLGGVGVLPCTGREEGVPIWIISREQLISTVQRYEGWQVGLRARNLLLLWSRCASHVSY